MTDTTASSAPGTPGPANPRFAARSQRKTGLLTLAGVVVVGLGAWLAYDYIVAHHFESTDNAYVQGDLIQITPQIGGTVQAVLANDTDYVKAGQPLVELDPADVRIAREQAEAALAQTVRQVRTLYANNATLAAQLTLREADLTRARNDLARADADVLRRQPLVTSGNVSREEFSHAQVQAQAARSGVDAAQAGVQAAREQLASNQAQTRGVAIGQHPSVLLAAAKLRETWLASERTTLSAPVDGYVARRTVQIGQRLAAGTPLMSVVALDRVWVEANFKEVQLRNIRIGQPVDLVADQYGKQVHYKGTVSGLGVGTGAAFALLPAQNATGNWIKVVQRVPVRIALDPQQLKEHPLRVGLSMTAEVDVHHEEGLSLADAPAPTQTTPAATRSDASAEADVKRIIAANLADASVH